MRFDRLQWHLGNWRDWMKHDDSGLGFPKASLCFQSGGGASADTFEVLCEEVDTKCALEMNALIDSLTFPYKTAINHVWLKVKHHYPTKDLDYSIALEKLLILAEKRKME